MAKKYSAVAIMSSDQDGKIVYQLEKEKGKEYADLRDRAVKHLEMLTSNGLVRSIIGSGEDEMRGPDHSSWPLRIGARVIIKVRSGDWAFHHRSTPDTQISIDTYCLK